MKGKTKVAARKPSNSKSRHSSAKSAQSSQLLTTFLTNLPTKEPSLSSDQMKMFAAYASSSSEE